MNIRPERVAQFMRREIAEILEHRLNDPRLAGLVVSVTDVEVTRDLSSAKVFVHRANYFLQDCFVYTLKRRGSIICSCRRWNS